MRPWIAPINAASGAGDARLWISNKIEQQANHLVAVLTGLRPCTRQATRLYKNTTLYLA